MHGFVGFTIAFREFMGTVPTLWDTIRSFKRDHPEVADKLPAKRDSLINFVTDDNGNTYNGCHFWTNFEVSGYKFSVGFIILVGVN
jgi:alpha 1,2-mannosyltransferase